jgi:hypothetical protein
MAKTDCGYIKIYRSMRKKGYWKDSEYVHLWVYLLMNASYQETEFLFNGKILKLAAGQFVTGRNQIVAETHIDRNKVERILKCFETEQQIEQQKTNKFRIITIRNWSMYQQSEQVNEPQMSSKGATSEQQVSTINKVNNIKKERIKIPAEGKVAFKENVHLTQNEYEKLKAEFGVYADKAIEYLSDYKIDKDYKNKDDNKAIRRWVITAVKEKERKENGNGQGTNTGNRRDSGYQRNNPSGFSEEAERLFAAGHAIQTQTNTTDKSG